MLKFQGCANGFERVGTTSQCPADHGFTWACIDKRQPLKIECPTDASIDLTPVKVDLRMNDSPGFAICAYPDHARQSDEIFLQAMNTVNCAEKRYLGQSPEVCAVRFPVTPYDRNCDACLLLSALCDTTAGFTCGRHSKEVKACISSELQFERVSKGGVPETYIHCCK
jgi:hypothetical protein